MKGNAIPTEVRDENPGVSAWSILTAYRGSIAHGMYVPNTDPNSIDDKDLISICVPPIDYYIGLWEYGSRGTVEIKKNEWDVVVYEIRKLIRMLMECNPNVLGLLWLDDRYYLKLTSEGRMLINNRDLFVSREKVYASFVGYAHSQLSKMNHLAYKGYMGEKRKRLVEQFGYDTKNAAHLVRLLRMGIEFLKTGSKKGEWTLEHVQEEAQNLFRKIEDARSESPLPESIDKTRIHLLCLDIVESVWRLS